MRSWMRFHSQLPTRSVERASARIRQFSIVIQLDFLWQICQPGMMVGEEIMAKDGVDILPLQLPRMD
jgi:hypothetical protein